MFGGSTRWKPEELIQLVDHVIGKLNVDPERVYVTGLSMGGYGTWRLAATYPDRFAAAVPICGGGEPAKWPAAQQGPHLGLPRRERHGRAR